METGAAPLGNPSCHKTIWDASAWRATAGHQRAEQGRPEVQWLNFLQLITDGVDGSASWNAMAPKIQSAYPLIADIINAMKSHQQVGDYVPHDRTQVIGDRLWIDYQNGVEEARDQFIQLAQSQHWLRNALQLAGWEGLDWEDEGNNQHRATATQRTKGISP